VGRGVGLELNRVGADELAAAVLALMQLLAMELGFGGPVERLVVARAGRTMDMGFGALTGRPFALTGARVPALSAALCSRWICVWG
jgi:hypothetical protein